eukprot:1383509-Amorphochlora_amoeboformis.AAC.1
MGRKDRNKKRKAAAAKKKEQKETKKTVVVYACNLEIVHAYNVDGASCECAPLIKLSFSSICEHTDRIYM